VRAQVVKNRLEVACDEIDALRINTEKEAFKGLITEIEGVWGNLKTEYSEK